MKVLNTSHTGYNVSDLDKILHFYVDILGLKRKFTLTRHDQYETMKKAYLTRVPDLSYLPENLQADLREMEEHAEEARIVYLEVADHQYLELFPISKEWPHHRPENELGYQHLALEVDDIQAAYTKMKENGVKVLTEPTLGLESTWQFWLEDPDGNRIELMQYTENSLQIIGN